ncbi:hypothetical protein WMY93_027862 [Mugilogobius chulae]|uniref:SCP domain-containing protein n=1 Tax=Mugilogobius chulae TaxID=88201 RepID=A0AAW0MU76_9GOBI
MVLVLVLLGSLASVEGILNEDQEELLVELHNRYRGVVQPSASAMLPLRWDGNLKLVAEGYAAKCVWNHNPELEDTGENLFAGTGELDLERALEKWFLERMDYNYYNNSCEEDKMCGHYTQMVWADTQQVGCAVHLCAQMEGLDWTEPSNFLVCNYFPAGNYEGMRPYVEGDWCSQCPENVQRCENNLCAPEAQPTEPDAIETEPTESGPSPVDKEDWTSRSPIELDQTPVLNNLGQGPEQEPENTDQPKETIEQEAVVPPPATESILPEPLDTTVPEETEIGVNTEPGTESKMELVTVAEPEAEPQPEPQPEPQTPKEGPTEDSSGGTGVHTEQEQKSQISRMAPPTQPLTPPPAPKTQPPENRGQKQKGPVDKRRQVVSSDSVILAECAEMGCRLSVSRGRNRPKPRPLRRSHGPEELHFRDEFGQPITVQLEERGRGQYRPIEPHWEMGQTQRPCYSEPYIPPDLYPYMPHEQFPTTSCVPSVSYSLDQMDQVDPEWLQTQFSCPWPPPDLRPEPTMDLDKIQPGLVYCWSIPGHTHHRPHLQRGRWELQSIPENWSPTSPRQHSPRLQRQRSPGTTPLSALATRWIQNFNRTKSKPNFHQSESESEPTSEESQPPLHSPGFRDNDFSEWAPETRSNQPSTAPRRSLTRTSQWDRSLTQDRETSLIQDQNQDFNQIPQNPSTYTSQIVTNRSRDSFDQGYTKSNRSRNLSLDQNPHSPLTRTSQTLKTRSNRESTPQFYSTVQSSPDRPIRGHCEGTELHDWSIRGVMSPLMKSFSHLHKIAAGQATKLESGPLRVALDQTRTHSWF